MISIAIDGPSGAGKSTLAREIAQKLNLIYLDTGAMYRAIGLKALQNGISCTDSDGVSALLPTTTVQVKYVNSVQQMFLDGVNITDKIRQHNVSRAASDVSAIPAVRLYLVQTQREIAASTNCVLDGRDIGTYVLPNATYKFYITASPEVRAQRRHKELLKNNQTISFEQVLKDINTRDYNDSNRSFAPLKQAEDAMLIDTTHMSIQQVVDVVIKRVGG